jgi:sodium transport system ATP-binding protein
MLEVIGVHKTYKIEKRREQVDARAQGRAFHAVRDVSFSASSGEVLGLLGPNGAGKSTLLGMLATALAPTAGRVVVAGFDVVAEPAGARARLGFLSGATGLYDRLTGRELLRYFGRLYGLSEARIAGRIEDLCAELDLLPVLDRRCGTLSTGNRQRISIARALIHEPDVAILDEPTTGLDVRAAESMLVVIERLRERGKTVVVSTHHMHEVERLCDRVVLLDEGVTRFSGTVVEMRAVGGGSLERAFLALTTPSAAERGVKIGPEGAGGDDA